MSFVLELPDSEVRDVAVDGDTLRIRLAAAAVRRDGVRGWLPAVTLVLSGATTTGDIATAFGRVADGRLRQDGRGVASLALPGAWSGALELTLRLANGTTLAAQGRALALTREGDAAFVEDLSC